MKSILIIEDDDNLADSLSSLLEMEGYSVKVCLRPLEALTLIDSFTPDLIILDVMMPLMSGTDFLHKIRGIERLKDIPIILMSASKEPENNTGFDWTFLKKPFDLDDLLNLLKRFLGGGPTHSSP